MKIVAKVRVWEKIIRDLFFESAGGVKAKHFVCTESTQTRSNEISCRVAWRTSEDLSLRICKENLLDGFHDSDSFSRSRPSKLNEYILRKKERKTSRAKDNERDGSRWLTDNRNHCLELRNICG